MVWCEIGWRLEFVGILSNVRFENVPVKWIERENYWDCGDLERDEQMSEF